MNIKPIKSEADYDKVLAIIDGLMGPAPDTPESDELKVLVTLVEAYEAEHWAIEAPDPIAAIEHVMEARGLRQKDFAEVAKVPEVLVLAVLVYVIGQSLFRDSISLDAARTRLLFQKVKRQRCPVSRSARRR